QTIGNETLLNERSKRRFETGMCDPSAVERIRIFVALRPRPDSKETATKKTVSTCRKILERRRRYPSHCTSYAADRRVLIRYPATKGIAGREARAANLSEPSSFDPDPFEQAPKTEGFHSGGHTGHGAIGGGGSICAWAHP